MDLLKILAVAGSGSILLVVVELIRRGKLKERYSLLWLLAGGVLLVFSLSRELLEYSSRLIGIFYPPSFLFLLAFFFLLLITLHFSVVISGLSEKNKKLAQELALLRQEMRDLASGRAEKKVCAGTGIRAWIMKIFFTLPLRHVTFRKDFSRCRAVRSMPCRFCRTK